MEKRIDLQSRGCNNYLESIDTNTYILRSNLGDYFRCGTDENNNIYFVDPPGGPFMDVGGVLPNVGKIESITFQNGKGFIITFSNDISS